MAEPPGVSFGTGCFRAAALCARARTTTRTTIDLRMDPPSSLRHPPARRHDTPDLYLSPIPERVPDRGAAGRRRAGRRGRRRDGSQHRGDGGDDVRRGTAPRLLVLDDEARRDAAVAEGLVRYDAA